MAMLIASVAMLILEYAGIRGFINVLKVPKQYLLPAVIALCIVGAFGSTNRMFDVYCTLGFGVLGYLMKRARSRILRSFWAIFWDRCWKAICAAFRSI